MHKPTLLLVAAAAVFSLSSCSQDDPPPAPSAPDVTQFEAAQCEAIKAVTPGFLESQWAVSVLSDQSATGDIRSAALKVSLDQLGSATKRTEPYTCEGWLWDRYLADAYLSAARSAQAGQ